MSAFALAGFKEVMRLPNIPSRSLLRNDSRRAPADRTFRIAPATINGTAFHTLDIVHRHVLVLIAVAHRSLLLKSVSGAERSVNPLLLLH